MFIRPKSFYSCGSQQFLIHRREMLAMQLLSCTLRTSFCCLTAKNIYEVKGVALDAVRNKDINKAMPLGI